MHWYVRYEGTEEISGPMNKEDALSMADQAGGMVFNSSIFDGDEETPDPEKAPVTSAEVIDLITELGPDGLCGRAADAIGSLVAQVAGMECAAKLSREKVITGEIHGGILTLDDVPKGVSVEVRDYDVGDSTEGIEEDDQGSYHIRSWGGTE